MSLLPLPLTGGALVMDNSTAEHFTTCPRSGQYYFIDKRELSGRKAALHFGGAIHKALEYRYKSGSIDLTQSILEGMVEKVRVAYTEWSPENDDYRSFDYAVRPFYTTRGSTPLKTSRLLTSTVTRQSKSPLRSLSVRFLSMPPSQRAKLPLDWLRPSITRCFLSSGRAKKT